MNIGDNYEYEWKKWKPGQKEDLAKRYERGESVADLAFMYGRTTSNIRTVLQNIGVRKRQTRADDKERRRIFDLIDKGWEDKKIAAKMGRCRATVQRIRLAAGKRKYKYSDMGDDGWPVGLSKKAIQLLVAVEFGFHTIEELRIASGIGKMAISTTIGRLIEKRIVVKRDRKSDAVYSLAERITNMRRDFARELEQKGG